VVKEAGSVVAMVALVSVGVAAQDARSPQDGGNQSGEPTRQVAAMSPDAMRKQISFFSGALRLAVQNGAEAMTGKARQIVPQAALMLSGPPDVFGFPLENVGPVFEVRVPGMLPNLPWRAAMLGLGQPSQVRKPVQPTSVPPRIEPTALTQANGVVVGGNPGTAPRSPAPSLDVDFTVMSDPDAAYTREVKNALIEAMLENSGGLRVAATESLTVVAHDSAQPDPLVPTSQSDFHTILFQIKGSDLFEYRDGKISQEDAKRRIKITEN
jgi:hypothetical protein